MCGCARGDSLTHITQQQHNNQCTQTHSPHFFPSTHHRKSKLFLLAFLMRKWSFVVQWFFFCDFGTCVRANLVVDLARADLTDRQQKLKALLSTTVTVSWVQKNPIIKKGERTKMQQSLIFFDTLDITARCFDFQFFFFFKSSKRRKRRYSSFLSFNSCVEKTKRKNKLDIEERWF